MSNCIGHKLNIEKLRNLVNEKIVAHAYLFVGKKSIGKKIVAINFAKSILCENPLNGEACGTCESCKTFLNNSDFKVLAPDKDVIKVDDIRNMASEIFLRPTISSRKVFIIDDADSMNEQAQNALLKILEEPPLYVTLILIASNKEKLLNTIKSRVFEIDFETLSTEELEEVLKSKNIEYTKEAIEFANGSVNRAIEFMNDDTFMVARELANVLLEKDFLKINHKLDEIKSSKSLKANIESILEKVMYIYHGKLRNDISFGYKNIEYIESALQNIKKNGNVDLILDKLMIDMCF